MNSCLRVSLLVALLVATNLPRVLAIDAPVSPNAQPGVAKLLNFLDGVQGNKILSGQQEIAWDPSREDEDVNYIIANTGKTPAVRGYDFLHYLLTPQIRATHDDTERAIQWAKNGGIVTFCTHLYVTIGSTNGQPHFYTPGSNGNANGTNFDIRQAVIDGTPENVELLAQFDLMADELKKLRDANVPVIWRPFHECGGTWFWWSRHGAEPFKQAYRLMFTRYTQLHGLNNLIWVFNPIDSGNTMTTWYPGDDVVDLISLDVYPTAGTHPTYAMDSQTMRDFKSGRKVVAMSECGSIPDPAELNSSTYWSYFCAWNGFENDLTRHTVAFLQSVYTHEKVITLDELPAAGYVPFPLTITTQPVDARYPLPGADVQFSVAVSGSPAPTYQWKRWRSAPGFGFWANLVEDSTFSGVNTPVLTVHGVTVGMRYDQFLCEVTNSAGYIWSNSATLVTAIAPSIITEPTSVSVPGGSNASFSASAFGLPTPTYQWKKGGVDIPGATGATYTIASTTLADQAGYTVVATNSAGNATSAVATLTLTVPAGFDLAGYYARNADIAAAFGNDALGAWMHFFSYGLAEGRQFDSQFIVEEYLLLNTDLTNAFGADRQAALMHWLTYGHPLEDRIGRVPIGFNVDSYLARYPDLAVAFGSITPTAVRNVTVWNHYVDYGVREGRSDGDFEAYAYLAGNADLAAVFGNDVEAAAWHWYFYGRREGRRIPGNFDVNGYRTRNPDVVVVWGNDKYGCWLHYRDTGVYENRVFDDLFRVLEYRARYSDVQTAYGNDLTGVLNHWLFYGKPEGRLGRNP